MSTFSFVGKIVPVKDTEKFKGYTETLYDSGWLKQRLVFNVVAGDNRHLVEINAGRWQDDKKNSVIYTMSRAAAGKKSEKIQIPWEDRNNPEVIEGVAGNRILTIDTDYMNYHHRDKLAESGDTQAIEDSNKKRRHFLASSDFYDFAKKVVYSEKIKDWTFRINGDVIYTYNEKNGQYYSRYEVNKIYRVDNDVTPISELNIPFYFTEDFMSKDMLEETGKAIISGYTQFYDQNTAANWFCPVVMAVREDSEKVDALEEVLGDFDESEVCKAVLRCQAIDGAQKRDISIDDLSEKVQKAVRAGLMSESQAIRNAVRDAGDQLYGDRIREIRFVEIINGGEPTVYTLENCTEKPHNKEDVTEMFDDEDEDI